VHRLRHMDRRSFSPWFRVPSAQPLWHWTVNSRAKCWLTNSKTYVTNRYKSVAKFLKKRLKILKITKFHFRGAGLRVKSIGRTSLYTAHAKRCTRFPLPSRPLRTIKSYYYLYYCIVLRRIFLRCYDDNVIIISYRTYKNSVII